MVEIYHPKVEIWDRTQGTLLPSPLTRSLRVDPVTVKFCFVKFVKLKFIVILIPISNLIEAVSTNSNLSYLYGSLLSIHISCKTQIWSNQRFPIAYFNTLFAEFTLTSDIPRGVFSRDSSNCLQ